MISVIIKNILFWFLAVLIFTIPLFFLLIWKCLIIILAKIIHPSWTVMRARDVMAIGDLVYKRPLLNIGLVLEVNEHLEVSKFRDHFSKVLLEPKCPGSEKPLMGNFYSNLARFGGVCFKRRIDPKSVNLETQIYETRLGENETISDLIAKFFYGPHEDSKPLWKIGVLQSKDGDGDGNGNTKILFKLHHSLGDGYSLIYIFDKLTNNSTVSVVPEFEENFCDKVKLIAGAPVTMMEFGTRIGEIKNPFPMTGVDTKMIYKCFTIDLSLVKQIRRKTGAHVAPILLTLQGGVLRRLLLAQNKLEDDLPGHIYSGHSLPWPSHPRNKMCNEWTVGVFKVPIKNLNPLERLRETDQDYTNYLGVGINRLAKRLFVPIMSLMPVQMGDKMASAETQMSTSWSSILAGNDYVLMGKPVNHIYPFVGHTVERMALTTISLSHSNKIDVMMGANCEFIHDEGKLENFTGMIQEELESLLALCGSRPSIIP